MHTCIGPCRIRVTHPIATVGRYQGTTKVVCPRPVCVHSSSVQSNWELADAAARFGTAADTLVLAYNLGMTHDGDKILFSNLNFAIKRGQKVAVVGRNGSGKSTLLKVAAGIEKGFVGSLFIQKNARIGYLPQEPKLREDLPVLDAILQSDAPIARAVRRYRRAIATAGEGQVTKELEESIEKMNELNAWDLDVEALRLLEALGLKNVQQPVAQLSGGQKKRVALAAALLGRPDLLVMDEPTNHMDVDTIALMEQELTQEHVTLLLVTHDRFFMEAICNRMVELDAGSGFVHNFGGYGSWERFKQAKEERRIAKQKAAERAQTLLRVESSWMSRQPKAREAKSRSRQQRYYQLVDKAKDLPKAELELQLNTMGTMVRQGGKVVTLKNARYKLEDGKVILSGLTYNFTKGERIGVVGPNGAGKTTLLDVIAGLRPLSGGERQQGETIVTGYLTQHLPPMKEDWKLLDYIKSFTDDSKARAQDGWQNDITPERMLEQVGFPRARQFQKVESLSGGERRRLHLATVLASRPNLLILDEPTNDLDLQTVEAIEQLLDGYKGTLLVVSHDRTFMDNVTDVLFVLRGDGTVEKYEGTYSEYLEDLEEERLAAAREEFLRQKQQQAQAAQSSKNNTAKTSESKSKAASKPVEQAAAPAAKPVVKRKLGFYEEKEFKRLEVEIEQLSKKRTELEDQVAKLTQEGDFTKVAEVTMQLATVQESLDTKEMRWLELAEISEGV